MPEITTNVVPCCATDIGTGRIWWEWSERRWVAVVKPYASCAQKSTRLNTTGSRCHPLEQTGQQASVELARSELG
ncbi:MAG: hypothetical protein K0R61_1844 [Microvirga sp.]|nr:hypothetical protein [Microvirga sp.]